jgi:hypothetical protein
MSIAPVQLCDQQPVICAWCHYAVDTSARSVGYAVYLGSDGMVVQIK